jgi:hypothetical protein
MQLKFKLTDTATGASVSPSKYVIDPEQEGVLIRVFGGDTLDHDTETSHIVPRLFTGFHDTDNNEIYGGDVLSDQNGEPRCAVYFENGMFMVRFADERQMPMMLMFYMLICGCAFVSGNRWQPEFKGVFGND